MGSGVLGVDGEIIDGEYRVLGTSGYRQLSLRGQLTSRQCFDFLLDCATEHKRLYGYGLGLDVCHWIRDLTDRELNRLYREGRCYTEQGLAFYRVVYRPNVFFRVDRLRGMPTGKWGKEVVCSATVIDLMRWHRQPFADVASDWRLGTDDERAYVRAIKEERPGFSEISTGLVERYNQAECRMISELGGEMEHGLRQLGLPLSYPLTSGGVAGRLATQYRVQDYHGEPPEWMSEPLQGAFYGGRMQTCRFGRFGPARHYDIRSAYSWALGQLPDMLGTWAPSGRGYSKWGVRLVEWDIPEGEHPVMPFPHRDRKGYIHYPPRGRGWYWSCLVKAAIGEYPDRSIRVLEGYDYTPLTTFKPFWYMEELHGARMALKQAESPLEGLLKLIMVSTWGRLCSDGVRHRYGHGYSREKSPTRGLIDWAGMTTALIQARLLEAALVAPEEFISCCVDGYWTTGDRGPVISEALGGWSVEEADELFLLRQSCYWKRNGCDWAASTSGIASGDKVREEVLAEWARSGMRGKVIIADRACKGLRQCASEGNGYGDLGQFRDTETLLGLNPGMMRYGHVCPTVRSGSKVWERWLPYWPPVAHVETMSEPFTPKCERMLEEELLGDAANEVAE